MAVRESKSALEGNVSFQQQAPRKSTRRSVGGSYRSWIGDYNKSLRQLGSNNEEAFRLNAIAAEKGMHDAVLAMGWFYLNGVGVKANTDEAVRWYRKAARGGDLSAFFSLGHIAYLENDYVEALLWLNRAADKGHPRSKYLLARMFWGARGVPQDRKRARRLLADAAALNVVEARRAERYLAYLGTKAASEAR